MVSAIATGKCFKREELQFFVPPAAWETSIKHLSLQTFKGAVSISSFLNSYFGNHSMSHRDLHQDLH